MQRIGFSTGLLYKALPKSSLAQRVDMLVSFPYPINAPSMPIEVHIAHQDQLQPPYFEQLKFSLLQAANKLFLHRISIHAPTQMEFPSREAEKFMPMLRALTQMAYAPVVVFHPDKITDPSWVYTQFPETAAVENLDQAKGNGRSPVELTPFKDEGIKFVLDLNHAQSNGIEVPETVTSLVEFMGDRIAHAHISGLVSEANPHCLYSHNGTASQADLIGKLPSNIPLIHEGVIIPAQRQCMIDVLSQELQLLNRFSF